MDRIRWYPNERVQLNDFELATGKLVMQDNARAVRCLTMPRGRSTGSFAANEARILSGFAATVPGGLGVGTELLLQQGKAVMGFLDGTSFHFGVVHGEVTPGSYTLDFGLTSPGTYNVYVRFTQTDSSQGNRVFWNPAGAPPSEEVDTIYTRKASTWEATFQDYSLAPPGNGEWVLIWQVTVSAGPVISAIADKRHFYFEGSASSTDGPYEFEWGKTGTTDRNTDRALYGIGDFHWFAQMVRRQLSEIIEVDTVGLNATFVKKPLIDLNSLAVEHYGPAEDQPGAHRFITLYDEYYAGDKVKITPEAWNTFANGVAIWDAVYGTPGDWDCPIMNLASYNDGTNTYQFQVFDPRGPGAGFGAVGDGFLTSYYAGAHEDFLELANVAYGRRTLSWASTPELVLRMGTSATARGLAAEQGKMFAKDGFMLWEAKTVTVNIPLQWAADVRTSQNGWVLYSDSSPLDAEAALYNCNTSLRTCRFFISLPDGAVLNYIDVMWRMDTSPTSGNSMRLYAQKHTLGFDYLGSKSMFDDNTIFSNLHASQQYIECTSSVVTYQQRFSCTAAQANRTFDQHKDVLVVSIVDPNADTVNCWVFWLRVNFTYDWAMPYPVS